MVSLMSFEVSLKLFPFGWAFTSTEDLKDIDIFVISGDQDPAPKLHIFP